MRETNILVLVQYNTFSGSEAVNHMQIFTSPIMLIMLIMCWLNVQQLILSPDNNIMTLSAVDTITICRLLSWFCYKLDVTKVWPSVTRSKRYKVIVYRIFRISSFNFELFLYLFWTPLTCKPHFTILCPFFHSVHSLFLN